MLKIGLTAPIETLREKINFRLNSRLNQGMIEEAEKLYKQGLSLTRMRELGLDYGVIANFIEGKITKEQLIKLLLIKEGQYAKRQVTWFKKEKNVNWFDITNQNIKVQVESLVDFWYHQP